MMDSSSDYEDNSFHIRENMAVILSHAYNCRVAAR